MKDIMIIPAQIKAIKDDDPDYIYVDAIASVYNNIDLGGDRVLPGAFSDDIKAYGNERPILWQHDTRQPVGMGTFSDGLKSLNFRAKLPKDDDFVMKRVIPQMRVGSVKTCSIGYDTVKQQYNSVENVRDLIVLKLYEASFVTFAMNPEARILSLSKCMDTIETKGWDGKVKNSLIELAKTLDVDDEDGEECKNYPTMDENTAWDKAKAIKQAKENTNSDDVPADDYKKYFMYCDAEHKDEFSAYKLPFVYKVGEELKAVPKAIYAVAASLVGVKGGLDIPADAKEKIKEQVNKYYKKFGKELPFKDNGKCFVDIDTLKAMDKKHFQFIFESDVEMSQSAKDYIFKCFKASFDCPGDAENIDAFIADFTNELKSLKEVFEK